MPNTSRPRRLPHLRQLLAPAVDNWLSRGYLAVVAVSLGFFLGAWYVGPDPGLSGAYPLAATAPFSFLALLVSIPAEYSSPAWLSPSILAVGMGLSGLVNAVLLGRFAWRRRGVGTAPATS
ncbi:SCO4225 family membrane protein [Streptomyces sp. NBC_01304]|uniref:SCO4225 family membrane protein n=1 Tax=Streptomyces sp. NBC_01304 TaxID=2903818 RepID=UPI002E111566|nr:hypothetical protein OG430_21195 [Streptomyces sp. NBC_01304]